MKNSYFFCSSRKFIALSTAILFLTQTLLYGQTGAFSLSQVAEKEFRISHEIQNFQIPSSLGTIQKMHAAGPSTVFLIQDAHSQVGTQRSIHGILKYLKSENHLGALFLEGAFKGPLPKKLLHFEKDDLKNRKLIEHFLKNGLVGGSGLYLYDHEKETPAYGVEDPELYLKNLDLFRSVYEKKSETDRWLAAIEQRISSLGSKVFNPELRSFLREWQACLNSRRESLYPYDFLTRYAERVLKIDLNDSWNQFDYPQLVRFAKLRHLEKEKTAKTENDFQKEKKQLLEWLGPIKSKTAQKDKETLQKILSSEKDSSVSDLRTYFEDFYSTYHSQGFRFEKYPNLTKQIAVRILSQELNGFKITEETNRLSDLILDRLAKTKKEKELVAYFHRFLLLRKFFALELTREEYLKAVKELKGLRPSKMNQALKIKEKHRSIETSFEKALEFYRVATHREEIIFKQMLKELKSIRSEKSALVLGGFHTQGFEDYLKKHNFSFVTIMPASHEIEGNQNYIDLMMLRNPEKFRASTVPQLRFDLVSRSELRHKNPALADFFNDVAPESPNKEPLKETPLKEEFSFRSSPFAKILSFILALAILFSGFSQQILMKIRNVNNPPAIESTQQSLTAQSVPAKKTVITFQISSELLPGKFEIHKSGDFGMWNKVAEVDAPASTDTYSFTVDTDYPVKDFFRVVRVQALSQEQPNQGQSGTSSSGSIINSGGKTNLASQGQGTNITQQVALFQPLSLNIHTVVGTFAILWDANHPSDNVTDYKVYIGPQTRSYTTSTNNVGNKLIKILSANPIMTTNFFAITASNQNGESDFSVEVVAYYADPQIITFDSSNLTPTGSSSVSETDFVAQSFTTGSQNQELSQVTIYMDDLTSAGGNFFVKILDASGAELATLDGSADPATAGSYDYTASSPLTLLPNSTYYIAVGVETGAGVYNWVNANVGTPDVGTSTGYITYISPGPWSSLVNDGTIYGLTIASTQIPVPNPRITTNQYAFIVPKNGSYSGDLRPYAVDPNTNNVSLNFVKVSDPNHGTLNFDTNGTFTFTAATNYQGFDSFDVKASNGTHDSRTVAIKLLVDTLPQFTGGGNFYVHPNRSKTGVLTATDADGDTTTFQIATQPTNGIVALNVNQGTNTYTYTPTANYTGPDSFQLVAHDGLTNSYPPVTFSFNVTNTAPVVFPANFSILPNTDITSTNLTIATDAEGDNPLTYSLVSLPQHGSASITNNAGTPILNYTHEPGFSSGTVTLTYKANDGDLDSSPATITINVGSFVDVPPTVSGMSFNVFKNQTLNDVIDTGFDANGDAFTYSFVTGPSHGTLNLALDGSFDYTPNQGYSGTDGFTFRATALGQNSGIAAAVITIQNTPPFIDLNIPFSTGMNTPLNGFITAVDDDGDPTTIELITPPGNGKLELNGLSFLYTPARDFVGDESFVIRATDGTDYSSPVTVTIEIIDQRPVITPPGIFLIAKNATLNGDLSGTVTDPNNLTYTISYAVGPAHGNVNINSNGTFEYTPTPDYVGTDAFAYTAINSAGLESAPAAVSISITNTVSVGGPPTRPGGPRVGPGTGNPGNVPGPTTLYDHANVTPVFPLPFTAAVPFAQAFQNDGHPTQLDTVVVFMAAGTTPGRMVVEISDSSGNLLGVLSGHDNPFQAGRYDYTGAIALSPNATYTVKFKPEGSANFTIFQTSDGRFQGTITARSEARLSPSDEAMIQTAIAAEQTLRSELRHINQAILQRVFPERFETKNVLDKTHAVIFAPLDPGLSREEQLRLIQIAADELRSLPGKVAILATSVSFSSEELREMELRAGSRLVVLSGIANPSELASFVFDFSKNKMISSDHQKQIQAAIQKAYRNTKGQGSALRNLQERALVLGTPEIFAAGQGKLSLLSQQFVIRAQGYDEAHLRYAIRIGGHLKLHEIDERLRANLEWQQIQPGRFQISFSRQGLSHALESLVLMAQAQAFRDRSA